MVIALQDPHHITPCLSLRRQRLRRRGWTIDICPNIGISASKRLLQSMLMSLVNHMRSTEQSGRGGEVFVSKDYGREASFANDRIVPDESFPGKDPKFGRYDLRTGRELNELYRVAQETQGGYEIGAATQKSVSSMPQCDEMRTKSSSPQTWVVYLMELLKSELAHLLTPLESELRRKSRRVPCQAMLQNPRRSLNVQRLNIQPLDVRIDLARGRRR